MLTNEVDSRIARAYVALADDDDEQQGRAYKVKEASVSQGKPHSLTGMGLENLAIERYLDDLEWETEEIKAGRRPKLSKFPFGDFTRSHNGKDSFFKSAQEETWT